MGVWLNTKKITTTYPTKPKTNSSVMYPYCKGMRYLKVVGLPLKITTDKGGVTTFKDMGRRRKCGINAGEVFPIKTRF